METASAGWTDILPIVGSLIVTVAVLGAMVLTGRLLIKALRSRMRGGDTE